MSRNKGTENDGSEQNKRRDHPYITFIYWQLVGAFAARQNSPMQKEA